MTQLFFLLSLFAFLLTIAKYITQDVTFFIQDFAKLMQLEERIEVDSKRLNVVERVQALEKKTTAPRRPKGASLGSVPPFPKFRS